MFQGPITTDAALAGAFDLRGFARRLVCALIERETDLTEKKARILIAYEHGHLTAGEAEDWIVLGGMAQA